MALRASTPSIHPNVSPDRDESVLAKAFDQECVLFFAEVVHIFGVPKSVGQIYGILYASPLPLCFSDIVARLDISKGSVSQGLALLRSLGAINEANGEGRGAKCKVVNAKREATDSPLTLASLPLASDAPRREYFEPELSLRRLVSGVLLERIAPIAATTAERLTRLRTLAEKGDPKNAFYLDRAKQLNIWRRRLRTVLPVLSTLLGPKLK